MEATTASATTKPLRSTGSKTIADLLARAVDDYGDRPAVKYLDKPSGEWRDVTYREVGEIVFEIARGLIDLGIQHGERVALLCNTRPEWTYADYALTSVGAVVVPVYPTNSPEECEWVTGNSESVAIVCEDQSQVAKIVQVRDRLPNLRSIVVIDGEGVDPAANAVTIDELRERGRGRDADEVRERYEAVTSDDAFTFIYTSGTTGPPKGCVLTHGNYRSVMDMCIQIRVLGGAEDMELVYLFLPLAHAYALLIQLLAFDLGATIAYYGGDTKQIVPELAAVKPTYLPSVPRIFEKIYTLVTSNVDPETMQKATQVGKQVRDLQQAGQPVPPELQAAFDQFDEKLFKNVRAAFGGRVYQANTGAAPIAKEILEFFWACGVPVLEGYGMTETATVATTQTVDDHRFGTVGKPLPGVEIKIAGDGEILIKGANIFQGYYKNDDASFGAIEDGWLHTGDIGSLDEAGFLSITGRKKDIIITAGGKNLTPANFENDMKQTRWVSQCVMHGDRRPYPVALITLDEEEIVRWAQEQGLPTDMSELARHPRVHELIQAEVDRANAKYAQVEQVKRFAILDHDLTQETGELTPTLKVKRNVVSEKYADVFEGLYGG